VDQKLGAERHFGFADPPLVLTVEHQRAEAGFARIARIEPRVEVLRAHRHVRRLLRDYRRRCRLRFRLGLASHLFHLSHCDISLLLS
jgi:hypothetical protein